MPVWGVTPAGFVVKPLANILEDMQQQVLQTIDPAFDLSPQTPDGQMLGIVANTAAPLWELLQVCWNQYNRNDTEGQGLDNLGDLTGTPREGSSFTQVFCNLTISAAHAPYPAGSLVAFVTGSPSFTFSNQSQVLASQITGGVANGVLFQAQTIGPTASVNPATLVNIATPVTGWTAITNPAGQSQEGANAELDPAYVERQAADVAAQGSCNPSATVAAIAELGAAQSPPVTLTATVFENETSPPVPVTIGGLTLQPNQYAVFVYDGGTGWLSVTANQQLVGQVLWNNRPSGNQAIGAIGVTIQDPVLGQQSIAFSIPTSLPLFIVATVAIRANQSWTNIQQNIQSALVAAAVAPTPSNGVPPSGQLAPGSAIIGSQLESVIMGVPGVLDVQSLTFGLSASPVNTAPIPIAINQVATILQPTVATNVVLIQGIAP